MDFKEWLSINESTEDDNDLINALSNYQTNPDDANAKNDFYSSVINFVHAWCKRKDCNEGGMTTEDLASNVYTKLASKINDPENGPVFFHNLVPDDFPKYLTTVIGNSRIDAKRRQAAKSKISGTSLDIKRGATGESGTIGDYVPSKEFTPEEKEMRSEKIDIVRKAIENLKNPNDRQIADLVYNQDMKYTDIAEKLGIPLNTVKSRVFSLHRKIRDALSELDIFS